MDLRHTPGQRYPAEVVLVLHEHRREGTEAIAQGFSPSIQVRSPTPPGPPRKKLRFGKTTTRVYLEPGLPALICPGRRWIALLPPVTD